jgi:hypothetical protein
MEPRFRFILFKKEKDSLLPRGREILEEIKPFWAGPLGQTIKKNRNDLLLGFIGSFSDTDQKQKLIFP